MEIDLLSDDGVALWGKIGRYHSVELFYRPTQETFSHEDIGQMTSDGLREVVEPTDGDDDFYWILTSRTTMSEGVRQSITRLYEGIQPENYEVAAATSLFEFIDTARSDPTIP